MLDMTIFSFGSPHIISKKTFLLRVKKEADIGRYNALQFSGRMKHKTAGVFGTLRSSRDINKAELPDFGLVGELQS